MKKLVFPALLLLAGCSIDERALVGQWQATAFFENGQLLATPLDAVSLQFTAQGGYTFASAGYYREAGSFRLSMRYLFLVDSTELAPKEHVLKVLYLSDDSLKIRMEKEGREQVLFFAKQR